MDSSGGGFLAFASFGHVRGLLDTDGRPLGEVKASPRARAFAHTELAACDYPDERSSTGLPMNVSALLQINDHWRHVLGSIRRIRAAFIERTTRAELSLLDLWRIAHAAVSVTSFHCLTRGPALAIPVSDAALFKATAGIKFALRHAEVARLEGRDTPGTHPSSAALWSYIQTERLLIGTSQVCAGPEMMIRELLDVLVSGAGSESNDALDQQRLLDYADLLAVWETLELMQRAEDGNAGEHLTALCGNMLRDICAATEFEVVPDSALGRNLIEDRLENLFGRGRP